MLYLGLGNTGTSILWNYYQKILSLDESNGKLVDKISKGEVIQLLLGNIFVVGDADVNNKSINEIRNHDLLKYQYYRSDSGNTNIDQYKFDKLDLDSFWSGGCGVYHIIGELLAEKADLLRTINNLSLHQTNTPISILFSVGGGTGGGISSYLLESNLATEHTIRAFGILPELDQFQAGGEVISGPDEFQCASAGRFLAKFLADSVNSMDIKGAGSADDNSKIALFLISNSYLRYIPQEIKYDQAIKRLNNVLFATLYLIPKNFNFPPKRRLITFGIGKENNLQDELELPQDNNETLISNIADSLISSALNPINLESELPTGLSMIPRFLNDYNNLLTNLLMDLDNFKGDETDEINPDYDTSAKTLLKIFRKCESVDMFLVANEQQDNTINLDDLSEKIQEKGEKLFGQNTEVTIAINDYDENKSLNQLSKLLKLENQDSSDILLLVLISDLVIEDIYRLIVYYLETSFDWNTKEISEISINIARLLREQQNVDDLSSFLKVFEEGIIRNNNSINNNQQANYFFKTKDGNLVEADRIKEEYNERFWGNINDLKNKVLQSLDTKKEDFEDKQMTLKQVAHAIAYLHYRIWRYES